VTSTVRRSERVVLAGASCPSPATISIIRGSGGAASAHAERLVPSKTAGIQRPLIDRPERADFTISLQMSRDAVNILSAF